MARRTAAHQRNVAQAALEKALAKDEAGDHEAAFTLYRSAASCYMKLGAAEVDEARKQAAMSRLADIIGRAEALQLLLCPPAEVDEVSVSVDADGSSFQPPELPDDLELPEVPSAPPVSDIPAAPGFEDGNEETKSDSGSTPLPTALPDSTVDTEMLLTEDNTPTADDSGGRGPRRAPTNSRMLSREEVDVLRRSSHVNGLVFVPFLGDDVKEQFDYPGKRFCDPDGLLQLSPKQLPHLRGWQRPADFCPRFPVTIRHISAFSIQQELVGDCSFVASLCAAAAYERRWRRPLITRCLYPQDSKGAPVYNPSGKYMVKLKYNGIARKVVIDDMLPVDARGRLLVTTTLDRNELWVPLIEKAYMKLNGGYAFPGSNSGVDLYSLTGWLPDSLHPGSPSFDADRSWARLKNGIKYGDCLCTVATGEMDEAEADRMGLVPSHAYAVLAVEEVGRYRMLMVKNPWSHRRWKGRFSAFDTKNWTPRLKTALRFDQAKAQRSDNGVFWIDYDSLLRFFPGIFLSWNPGLFKHFHSLHGSWPLGGPSNDRYNLGYNPQYMLEVRVPSEQTKASPVWLLVTRHVATKSDPDEFLTLHVFDRRRGLRVYYPTDCMLQGVYSNNQHCLIRFDAPAGTHRYTLVLSQLDKKRAALDYTLEAYSSSPLRLRTVPLRLPEEVKLIGRWTAESAAGPHMPAYVRNPGWRIDVEEDCGAIFRLEAPVAFSGNIRLFAGGGRPAVGSIELKGTGDYRSGFCYMEVNPLRKGSYAVLCSTFTPGQCSSFFLKIGSTMPVRVTPLRSAAEEAADPAAADDGSSDAAGGSAAGGSGSG
eukprot:PLAT14223.1.p1 GENE.PLAT14223.1~~PLAT14223.1.p1  ORF type:complete len:818 (-),score=298.18 PLAT14223.1:803-3256(-)